MENNQTFISIHKLAKAFEKIYKGLNQFQLGELDKELIKMYPSDESEVLFMTGYDEETNSIGVSLYISSPSTETKIEKIDFDKLMFAYLVRADLTKMSQVFECLKLMERKSGEEYEVDFIPVHYTETIDKHSINFRIIKN